MKSGYYQEKRKQHSILKGMIGILFIFIIIILFYFIAQAKLSTIETSYQSIYRPTIQGATKSNNETKDTYSYLIVAIGEEEQDTNFVSRVKFLEHLSTNQPEQQMVRFQIPPQTVPSWDSDSLPLSHLYTEQGLTSVIQRTEEIMAVDYDYIIAVHLPYLRPLIDEIGEIPVQFKENLRVDEQDFSANEIYWLNGQQVEQLLQVAKYENRKEYPRMIQGVLNGLISELFNPQNALNLDHFFDLAESSIQTDIPFELFQSLYLNRDREWMEDITEVELEQRSFQNEYGAVIEISPSTLDLIHQLSN